jgi:hypothetical protein
MRRAYKFGIKGLTTRKSEAVGGMRIAQDQKKFLCLHIR